MGRRVYLTDDEWILRRQALIALCCSDGISVKQMASTLGISYMAVSSDLKHVYRILRAVGEPVRDRISLDRALVKWEVLALYRATAEIPAHRHRQPIRSNMSPRQEHSWMRPRTDTRR